jgi:ectoine hydroxylase-related dioxygenase (phytanoyl-CoA dioxygenase family)
MLSQLDQQGYVVLPGLLAPEVLERLRLAFGTDSTGPGSTGTEHVDITEATPAFADWLQLAEHPELLSLVRHVLGEPLRLQQLHGRNPRPGFGLQGLHADAPARPAGAPSLVATALWMIDDFTEDNGATRIVPGTHLAGRAVPRAYAQPHALHPEERVVTGTAGSVLLFNGHLWHAGGHNRSEGPRRSAQLVWVTAAGRIPWDN